jgi:hypothetical protein
MPADGDGRFGQVVLLAGVRPGENGERRHEIPPPE